MTTDQGAIYVTDNTAYTWTAAVQETVDATLNRTVSSGGPGGGARRRGAHSAGHCEGACLDAGQVLTGIGGQPRLNASPPTSCASPPQSPGGPP